MKQHIDSFNYFLNIGLQEVIRANELVDSEINQEFELRFKAIRVGMPTISED